MSVKVLAIGKKHESWVSGGIDRYAKRLKKPFDVTWQLLPHSSREGDAAREEESARILAKVGERDHLMLLDERGTHLDSPGLSRHLQGRFDAGQAVTLVIGGAYGVDSSVHTRANTIWSLSPLVFPHQLVRLIVAEQLYRAQEIAGGRPYHHV
ncbi:23S rRNA (pseudouridine(1915)-N(3))-methyltransferase RlmH [Citricoccus sp.]|uniref:23S rRNA (pseudouridine(1915)-N(3))-methyltransferase RlmH n=1 Tax=Citricoccus sp. TaxID=1978372 RepID=UPI0028BED4C7|nr:23S rRNA (pseudouridine(1915)-N(3))-methyltransferase RlmH [Citricoccus sp.]